MARSIKLAPDYSDWTKAQLIERLGKLQRRIDEHDRAGAARSAEIEALKQNENLLERITDALPVLISYVDSEQRYRSCNKAYEAWFGHTRESICGRHVKDVHGDAAYAALQGYIETALSGEMVTYEDTIPYGSGGTRHIHAVYVPDISDKGETKGFFVTVTDITERKRADEALRESEERFRGVAEITTDWIWELGPDLRYTWVSPRIEEILGETASYFLGKTPQDLGPPDEEHEKWARRLEDYSAHRPIRDVRIQRTIDGKQLHILLNANPIFGPDREFLGYRGIGRDITAEVEARQETTRIEERFLNSIDNLQEGIALYDADERLLFCNRRYKIRFGVAEDYTVPGARYEDIVRARVKHGFLQNWAEGQEEQWIEDCLRQFRNPSGPIEYPIGQAWVQGRFERLPDGSTIVIGSDITELKEREEKLRESEERFRDVAESVSDWIWEFGPDLRFTWISSRIEEIFGRPPEHFIGKTLEELKAPEDDRGEWARQMESMRARRPLEAYSYRRILDDGTECHFVVSGKPIFGSDGEFLGYRGSGRDITAEVEARQNAARVEERFLAAIDNLRDGVALFDSDERLVFCNQSYRPHEGKLEEFLASGVTFEEFLRARIRLDRVPEEAKGREEEWIQHRLEHFRQGAGMFETHYGDQWFQVRDERLSDGSTISIASDVTELKYREDALRQAQKMEAVGQLTGGVAHDFNNLLAVILGNAELLGEQIADKDGLVQKIVRAASRGAELTHRLLAFSRRQPLQTNVTDVDALITSMLDMLRRTLGETIEIKMNSCADPWNIEIDPAQMESAILNAAINARDAMPKGGTLEIETANVVLDRSDVAGYGGCSPGDYVRLAMADTGVGMSANVLEHAIEPFFTTKDVGEGTGLGLSMIYGFVRQSGGFVEIESEPNQGCAVRLYLPRAIERADAVTANDTGPMPQRSLNGTVLVVEDDPDVRELVVRLLADLGFATVEADDGATALARLEDNPDIDLLFTDVVLPHGMSGPDIAREARRLRPDLKIVFTSGYPDKVIQDLAWDGEMPLIVSKPYTRAALAEALSNATVPPI